MALNHPSHAISLGRQIVRSDVPQRRTRSGPTLVLARTTEVLVTTKAKATVKSCFVIMPFAGHWQEYYDEIYSPAILDAGLKPVRADEIFSAPVQS